MSFDTIAFVVTADPLGSIETSVGVPLTTALTSDPDKGCPTILSTTGVSAARCLVPFVTTDGEICFGVAPAPKKEAAYVSSGLVTASGEATAVLRRCEVFSSTATVQATSGTASYVRKVSFSSAATTRTTSGSAGYGYQRCEIFSSTPTARPTSGGAGYICGIIQRAVPENTQTFGDTGTVISLHFSSNAAARSTSGESGQCFSVIYDAPAVPLDATGTVGAVVSALFAASIDVGGLSSVTSVDDVVVADAYQSNFSVNVGSGDDYVVQDAFGFVLVPVITSDGELSWATCRSGCANTGGATSNEQITYIEPVTFVFSGSGLVTASGTANTGIDCSGVGGVFASGSVLVSTGDSLRSLGIAEVSGAAQVIVSSVKNGSGAWHSYGSAGLSYNALSSLINSHKERRVFVERDSRKCEIARGNFGAVLDREPRGDVCPQAPTRIKIAPNYQRGGVFPGPLRMVHRDESMRGGIVKLLEVA